MSTQRKYRCPLGVPMDYNQFVMKIRSFLLLMILPLLGCCKAVEQRDEPDIERFIDVLSTSIYLEKAYGHNPEVFSSELKATPWPEDIKALADSLLIRYGSDPDLWYEIYEDILEKSHTTPTCQQP